MKILYYNWVQFDDPEKRGRVVVRAVVREHEEGDIAHRVEERRDEDAAPAIHIEPDGDDPQQQRDTAMPRDSFRASVELKIGNEVPRRPEGADDECGRQRTPSSLHAVKGEAVPSKFLAQARREEGHEEDREDNERQMRFGKRRARKRHRKPGEEKRTRHEQDRHRIPARAWNTAIVE